jgi:hypothetical protein
VGGSTKLRCSATTISGWVADRVLKRNVNAAIRFTRCAGSTCFVAVRFDDVAQGEPAGFVGEVGNEFVNNTCYFKSDAVVVEMNQVAYSGRDDRGSHVSILCDLSRVVHVKFQVVSDVGNVHFVAVSHRGFESQVKSHTLRGFFVWEGLGDKSPTADNNSGRGQRGQSREEDFYLGQDR